MRIQCYCINKNICLLTKEQNKVTSCTINEHIYKLDSKRFLIVLTHTNCDEQLESWTKKNITLAYIKQKSKSTSSIILKRL